jgi:folate-dependent phosphoribosylglycinamide formyltransferase PurN
MPPSDIDADAPRTVLLTGTGLEHRYVAAVLDEALGGSLVVVVEHGAPPDRWRRVRRLWRRYTLRQLASRILAKSVARLTRREARRRASYARSLFPDAGAPPRWPADLRTVASHNGPECEALLRSLRPDVVAVYGTVMIRPPIIRLARRGVLNMHTGLSPRYRGSDTIFWPIHNGEPEWVGVTVHVLDEGIDSGPIVQTARPTIDADDDEDSLFCKCVVLGSRLLAEAVASLAAGRLRCEAQRLETGREYRFVDRTVAAEWRARGQLRRGVLRRVATPAS